MSYVNEFINYLKYLFKLILNYNNKLKIEEQLLENKRLKIVKELEKITEKQLNLDENNKRLLEDKRLNKKKELKEIKEKQYRFNLSEEDGILFDKIGYLQFTLLEDEHFRLSNLF